MEGLAQQNGAVEGLSRQNGAVEGLSRQNGAEEGLNRPNGGQKGLDRTGRRDRRPLKGLLLNFGSILFFFNDFFPVSIITIHLVRSLEN